MTQALVDYYVARIDEVKAMLANSTSALIQHRKKLDDFTNSIATRSSALAERDRRIQKLRKDLSSPELTAADIEAGATQLRNELILRRQSVAALESDAESKARHEIKMQTLEIKRAAYKQVLSELQIHHADAGQHVKLHEDWFATETGDAIVTLKNICQNLLQEISPSPPPPSDPDSEEGVQRELIKEAKSRIDEDVPAVLQEHCMLRLSVRVVENLEKHRSFLSATESVRDEYADQHFASEGAESTALQQYLNAQGSLQKYIQEAEASVSSALNLLRRVVDAPPVTSAERVRIEIIAALEEGDEALTAELAFSDAVAGMREKQRVQKLAVLNALVEDPLRDPSGVSTVQAANGELEAAVNELSTVKVLHTEEQRRRLDEWEVALPDSLWAAYFDYLSAIDLLNSVVSQDLTVLRDTFTSAEATYIDALQNNTTHRFVGIVMDAAVYSARAELDLLHDRFKSESVLTLRGNAPQPFNLSI